MEQFGSPTPIAFFTISRLARISMPITGSPSNSRALAPASAAAAGSVHPIAIINSLFRSCKKCCPSMDSVYHKRDRKLHEKGKLDYPGTVALNSVPSTTRWYSATAAATTRHDPLSTVYEVSPQVSVAAPRSEEHTSELQSRPHLVCR